MDEVTARLWHGVKKGDAAEVSAVLEQGASPDARDTSLRTPLMEAAKRGQQSILSLLLARGADVNAQDKDADTPLMYALNPEYTEVITLLLEAGASATVEGKSGDKASKQLALKQATLVLSTLFSVFLFIQSQRRPTKDKDMRKIETLEMAARLCGVFVTYRKYESIKQLLQVGKSGPPHNH